MERLERILQAVVPEKPGERTVDILFTRMLPRLYFPNYYVDVSLSTHSGKVRKTNEDTGGLAVFADPDDYTALGFARLVVADGMGGHQAGEKASEIVVESYVTLQNPNLIEIAKAASSEMNVQTDEILDGGSTVVALDITPTGLRYAHAGDSRLYYYDPKTEILQWLTEDHSIKMNRVRAGRLTREQARVSIPKSNYVMRSIVRDVSPLNDLKTQTADINPGLYILCSDGLWDEIPEEEKDGDPSLTKIIKENYNSDTLEKELINAALKAGGHDNITIAVAYVNAYERDGMEDELYDSGLRMLREEKISHFNLASTCFEQVLERIPNDVDANIMMAVTLGSIPSDIYGTEGFIYKKYTEKSIYYFKRALALQKKGNGKADPELEIIVRLTEHPEKYILLIDEDIKNYLKEKGVLNERAALEQRTVEPVIIGSPDFSGTDVTDEDPGSPVYIKKNGREEPEIGELIADAPDPTDATASLRDRKISIDYTATSDEVLRTPVPADLNDPTNVVPLFPQENREDLPTIEQANLDSADETTDKIIRKIPATTTTIDEPKIQEPQAEAETYPEQRPSRFKEFFYALILGDAYTTYNEKQKKEKKERPKPISTPVTSPLETVVEDVSAAAEKMPETTLLTVPLELIDRETLYKTAFALADKKDYASLEKLVASSPDEFSKPSTREAHYLVGEAEHYKKNDIVARSHLLKAMKFPLFDDLSRRSVSRLLKVGIPDTPEEWREVAVLGLHALAAVAIGYFLKETKKYKTEEKKPEHTPAVIPIPTLKAIPQQKYNDSTQRRIPLDAVLYMPVALHYLEEKDGNPSYVEQALDSIFAQKTRYSIGIAIVVDGTSEDRKILETILQKEKYDKFLTKKNKEYVDVRIDQTTIPGGSGNAVRASNQAVELALDDLKSKYVIQMDADNKFARRDAVDRLVYFMNINKKFNVAYADANTIDENGKITEHGKNTGVFDPKKVWTQESLGIDQPRIYKGDALRKIQQNTKTKMIFSDDEFSKLQPDADLLLYFTRMQPEAIAHYDGNYDKGFFLTRKRETVLLDYRTGHAESIGAQKRDERTAGLQRLLNWYKPL